MHIGYARVSTQDQDLRLQYAALQAAGYDNIYDDKASGATASRDGLTRALATRPSRSSFHTTRLSFARSPAAACAVSASIRPALMRHRHRTRCVMQHLRTDAAQYQLGECRAAT